MDSTDYLNVLSDKLQTANRTVILQKKRQREEIDERLENIETKFLSKKKFQTESIERAKISVDKAATLSNQTIKNFNLKTRKEQELVRNLRDHVQNEIQLSEREHQQKTELVVQRQTQKMTQVIEQIKKKSKNISENTQKSLIELNKALAHLDKDLQDEIEQRKSNCNQIVQDISGQVSKFNAMIQKQREHRAVSQQKIQIMMQEIKNKITTQIQNTSTKRKRNNASLLKLIESACHHLEEKLNITI